MTENTRAMRMEKRQKMLELRAQEVEKLNTDVRSRLIKIINTQIIYNGRYEYLEARYGIAARKWQNVCNKIQLPGINMLSSILIDYPFYTTWLMTGNNNDEIPQISPDQTIKSHPLPQMGNFNVIAVVEGQSYEEELSRPSIDDDVKLEIKRRMKSPKPR